MVQGYGFVEFSLPGAALTCKQAMDEIEQRMRPDPRRPRPAKSEGDLQKSLESPAAVSSRIRPCNSRIHLPLAC